jgi:hypothetical protein
MRALLVALLAAVLSIAIGMPVLLLLAQLVYGGDVPTQSFVRFATTTLFALAIGVFALVRRNAKIPGTFSNRAGQALVPKWPTAPVQRVFLLFAGFGLLVCAATTVTFYSDGNSRFPEKVLFDPPWYYKSYFYTFWCGAILFVIGCLGAFYYEASFGRLIRWLKGA